MKHPVSAILFDKDGTLIDFEGTWTPFARAEALRAANGDGEKAENLLAVLGLDPTGTRFLPDSIVAAGTNAEVAAVLWAGVDPAELVARTHAFNERAALHAIKGTVMLPGMGEALNALRGAGFKLGIATNDVRQGAVTAMEAHGLLALFDQVIGYDSVARPKPAPDMVLTFAEAMGVAPSAIAMVGDNAHDMHCARAAGAGLAIGVLSGTGTRQTLEALADLVIASATELPGVLTLQSA